MAVPLSSRMFCVALIGWLLLAGIVEGDRRLHRRSDLDTTAPPISASGYIVPLEGSRTCHADGTCTAALSAPPDTKSLKYLAIARGTLEYSCEQRRPSDQPVFVSQNTALWDAAPLIPKIPSEELFHTIIPQLYNFDYTELANSSLVCIGRIGTDHGAAVIDLFDVGPFIVNSQQLVQAPEYPGINLDWAYETSEDLAWDVYRVETVSGAPPTTCAGHNSTFDLDYAAEYWFYHA